MVDPVQESFPRGFWCYISPLQIRQIICVVQSCWFVSFIIEMFVLYVILYPFRIIAFIFISLFDIMDILFPFIRQRFHWCRFIKISVFTFACWLLIVFQFVAGWLAVVSIELKHWTYRRICLYSWLDRRPVHQRIHFLDIGVSWSVDHRRQIFRFAQSFRHEGIIWLVFLREFYFAFLWFICLIGIIPIAMLSIAVFFFFGILWWWFARRGVVRFFSIFSGSGSMLWPWYIQWLRNYLLEEQLEIYFTSMLLFVLILQE